MSITEDDRQKVDLFINNRNILKQYTNTLINYSMDTQTESSQFPLELILKYRHVNSAFPKELEPYKVSTDEHNHRKKYLNATLQLPEVKAYMNAHMMRRTMNNEDELLYDKLQGYLNKLSTTNFQELSNEIKDLPYVKKKHIYRLAERIIIKSIGEPTFSDTYAKLCQILMPYYIIEAKTEEKVLFRVALLTICQDIFVALSTPNIEYVGAPGAYERSTDYSKLKLNGLLKLLGELYKTDVINDKIIQQCFVNVYDLIVKGYDHYDALFIFLQSIAIKLRQNNVSYYNKVKADLDMLLLEANNFKFGKLASKFKIMEIMEYFTKIEKTK